MTSMTDPRALAPAGDGRPSHSWTARLGRRRLSMVVTAGVTVGCLLVLLLLLSVGHTTGGEIDGTIVATYGLAMGIASLVFLAARGPHRIILGILVVLWIGVALGGIGGYADHAKAITTASADQRARPPLAPLIFTVFGIAGAAALLAGGRRFDVPPPGAPRPGG